MNKTELINAAAKETALKKADVEKVVNAVIDNIQKTLMGGDKVQVIGFGTFEAKKRPARVARNPRTGVSIQVEESVAVAFKASNVLKDKLNGK